MSVGDRTLGDERPPLPLPLPVNVFLFVTIFLIEHQIKALEKTIKNSLRWKGRIKRERSLRPGSLSVNRFRRLEGIEMPEITLRGRVVVPGHVVTNHWFYSVRLLRHGDGDDDEPTFLFFLSIRTTDGLL